MPSWFSPLRRLSLSLAVLSLLALPTSAGAQSCARVIHADVVAFDQVFFWNRLGAIQPQGQMFALRHDVVPISGNTLSPGNVRLRADKRPRPLVLRMNAGDCLNIEFENLLAPTRRDGDQSATRWVSIHAVGMQWIDSTMDDGSYVGSNPNSMADVGQKAYYSLYAEREGEHLLHSLGAPAGGQGDNAQLASGLFGAIIVEPVGSRWFRSQVTREDLGYAITGTSSYGLPVIDYEAVFPTGHPRAGQPVLEMMTATSGPLGTRGKILYSDLTAIIAGPHPVNDGAEAGRFDPGTFPPNDYTLPDREQAFRELVTIYHDEVGAVQAFREFYDEALEHTLHSGRDAFAINYGTAGIGAEVLANRLGLGPMWDCNECKYEEFFLTSWVVGDPAMVVDVPANTPCGIDTTSPNTVGQDGDLADLISDTRDGDPCLRVAGPKATKAFFPDDPSNVYHGYLNDHTRFRVLHAGPKEHHVHHLHAHQWLYTADSDKSSYLDSQAIGPGGSFTAEIAYNGAGNLNRTPGDSIFHCHFYPHFAQGMWALWRVHDVFERGTIMDSEGRPATGTNRALPDGEIAQGTPIPGVVPLPGRPMPPMPKATLEIQSGEVVITGFSGPSGNPGFPFFVPGNAGHRPPSPPMDIIDDGGLPRHIIVGGTSVEAHTRLDFHKDLVTADAQGLHPNGGPAEVRAMIYHQLGTHDTCYPDGTCDTEFLTNGLAGKRGAPFAPPCSTVNRTYKAADIQDDVKLNKAGWHFPQQRFTALWEDVDDFLGLTLSSGGATASGATKKPPEPLFFRANSGDCIEYQFTNLVPNKYELDDFQVLSPTDILGQHIHLVKFDVLASDGAANGFNYEDGSFSPDEVRERINAIRAFNGCGNSDPRNGTIVCPVAEVHPFFGSGPDKNNDGIGDWVGAQTTAQLWWADPVRDNQGNDRTLRTVFTHDHFGPSTHQQAGLYAGLVVEPAGSTWYHNETGTQLGTRTSDGGPTSWQAVIEPGNGEPPYREFLLEFGDFQLAYEADNNGFPDPNDAINPPGREEAGIPDLLLRPQQCPGGFNPPCPELVSADDPGTMSVNYRNEPIALRVRNPSTNGQASGTQGDLSFAFQSIARSDASLNTQPGFYQPLTNDLGNYDPYTPMMRAYENDRVQIRIMVGSHEEGHNFSIHGVKWLFEPSEPDSGYRGSQMMGISEHFEFIIPQLVKNPQGGKVDRLWMAGSSTDDLWNGMWGLLRAYSGVRQDLHRLSNNQGGGSGIDPGSVGAYTFSCPKDAPERLFDVTAVAASQALPSGRLTYNARTDGSFGPLFDPTSIVYVRTADLDANDDVIAGLSIRMEPLVLRAAAGECIKLTLRNKLPETPSDLPGYNTLPMIVEGFNANDIVPSHHVGLHPQLLYYDVSRYDGANVGVNSTQTVAPGHFKTYEWYAGDVTINSNGSVTATPIEFGGTNLVSSDRIEHASKGAFGALIIEPENAFISEHNPLRRSEATITAPGDNDFHEIVLMFQNDVNMRSTESAGTECFPTFSPASGGTWPVENLGCVEDPEDSGQKAINYRTEPLWKRMQHAPGTDFADTDNFTDWWDVLSNVKVGGDPVTPVYEVDAGMPVRVRLLMAGGHSRNIVFALHGHVWDKEPWINDSTKQGQNSFSFWEGSRFGHGPSNHFDALLRNGAGGAFSVYGDYLYRDQVSTGLDGGLWGIIRVTE